MLKRFLDDTFDHDVRSYITLLTIGRIAANGTVRFGPPFIAIIARDFGVSLQTMGAAIAASEAAGLLGMVIGPATQRVRRSTAMVIGLSVLALASVAVAVAPTVWAFGAALFISVIAKIVYDIALNAWVADRVPPERRGRVVGVMEVSWAGALLIAVPVMAIAMQLTSWRGAYVTAAVAIAGCALVIRSRVASAGPVAAPTRTTSRSRPKRPRSAWIAVSTAMFIAAAAQVVFLTFGSWLEDEFGIAKLGIAVVGFSLGLVELLATTGCTTLLDRWGRATSVVRGTMLMVPAALMLATVGRHHQATGLIALGLFVLGFEFAIIGTIVNASSIVPGSPEAGLGMSLSGSTIGRFAISVPATALYERGGMRPAMVLSAALAICGAATMHRWRAIPST